MRTRSSRLRWLVVPALTVGLIAFGAGAATASAPAKKLKSATLNGSGSTLQLAYDQAAIAKFTSTQPNVTINYAGGGSGKGRQDLSDQVVDFAGSDSPFPAADLAKVKGGDILYFPTVVAPVTLSYNLSGVKNLQPLGEDDLEDLPAPDHDVGRPGDQGRQPEGQAAEHRHHGGAPLGQLGHDGELHDVPHQGRPDGLEARRRLDGQLAG